jgi:hypothetical protein
MMEGRAVEAVTVSARDGDFHYDFGGAGAGAVADPASALMAKDQNAY